MTISVKHTFQSAKPDGTDATLIQPSNWNDEHVMTAAAGKVIGRDTSGAGAVQELPIAVSPSGAVAVNNVIESTSGGFKFPDGTTQISAATATSYLQNVQSGNYTLVLSDAGKQIYSANTAAQVITVPTNASVAFPIGTLITIVNMGTRSIRLSNSGVSIYPNGSTTATPIPVISSGVSVQLIKTGTNSWNALFGSVIDGTNISYLVVAGGGGGGSSNTGPGAGGAGGMRTGTVSYATGTYTVTVGAGGTGGATGTNANGANGGDSVFSTITSTGGGGGAGPQNTFGLSGGSGGGGTYNNYGGGAGTAGQGNDGGRGSVGGTGFGGGGGGGAGAVGAAAPGSGGAGGAGLASSITGTSVFYAGGGGGGSSGAGGVGGGGAGSPYTSATGNGTAGTANTGGGGGGSGGNVWGAGGNGGSGVVIIASAVSATSTTGSPTVTIANGLTIYTFTSSGTITW